MRDTSETSSLGIDIQIVLAHGLEGLKEHNIVVRDQGFVCFVDGPGIAFSVKQLQRGRFIEIARTVKTWTLVQAEICYFPPQDLI